MRIFLTISLILISVLSFGQATQGTRVTAPIVPNDSSDVYPTHDETFGRGGYRSVSTIAQRDAIKPALRKEGMLVKVIQDNKTYTLKGGVENANWQIFLNIDSINNLKVTQKLSVQALPGAYSTTFPFEVKDSAGYTRGAISSKGMLIAGRQHNSTINVDALVLLGAKNQISGVDGIAVGTNSQAISDSSMVIGKNIINNRAGSVQVGYKNNYVSFDTDSARVNGNWPFLKKSYSPTWGSITGTLSAQTDLQNALNAKQNSLGTGTSGQFLSWDQTWQSLPGSVWGNITGNFADQTDINNAINSKQNLLVSGSNIKTINMNSLLGSGDININTGWGAINGTLSNQTDLQNALNAKQNSLGTGTSGQFLSWDQTWRTIPTGDYFLKYAGQVRQNQITESGLYDGTAAVIDETANEDFSTFAFVGGWNAGFQFESAVHYDQFLVRRRKNGVWYPWKELALKEFVSTEISNTTNNLTSYVNTEIGTKTATVGYTFTEQNADVSSMTSNLHKFGTVVCFNFRFYKSTADAGTVFVYLGQIPVGARPTSIIYGAINPARGTGSGAVTIDTDGLVQIHCGDTDEYWYGNLSWIIFNP